MVNIIVKFSWSNTMTNMLLEVLQQKCQKETKSLYQYLLNAELCQCQNCPDARTLSNALLRCLSRSTRLWHKTRCFPKLKNPFLRASTMTNFPLQTFACKSANDSPIRAHMTNSGSFLTRRGCQQGNHWSCLPQEKRDDHQTVVPPVEVESLAL